MKNKEFRKAYYSYMLTSKYWLWTLLSIITLFTALKILNYEVITMRLGGLLFILGALDMIFIDYLFKDLEKYLNTKGYSLDSKKEGKLL
jgi:hypothetical protein